MRILVTLKWCALWTEVDPLSGAARVLPGRFGVDPASLAALAWALRLAPSMEAVVHVVSVGPAAADEGLRVAMALGASGAERVDGPLDAASMDVAAAVAPRAIEADLVVAGARSIDRGSASFAPSLATHLGRAQACGLLGVAWDGEALIAERRLPGGRREHLRLPLPAVVSTEASTIEVPRAALPEVLGAAAAEIPVRSPRPPLSPATSWTVEPYRPRPRTMPPAPSATDPRDRIVELTGALGTGTQAQRLELPPAEAAAEIVAALRRWGYLDAG